MSEFTNFIILKRVLLIIIFLNSCLAFAQAKKDTARSLEPWVDQYKTGIKLLDSSRHKEAIRPFEKAIKLKKDYAEAYNKLALCHMELKNFPEAQKNLELSLKYKPDNFDCIKYLGRACYLNRKYPDAKKYYDDAQKMDPNDFELLCYIAELRSAGKDTKGAIEMYNSILVERENYAPALIGRGLLKCGQKDYTYGIKDLEQGIVAAKYQKIGDETYNTLARAKFESGSYKSAAKIFDTLVKRNPKNEDAITYRGACKLSCNDFSGAISDESEAIKINSKNYMAYNFRGTAKGGLKQYVEALKDFDEALKIKPGYASVYVNRAAIKMASKDRKGACEDLNRAEQFGDNEAYKYIQQYCGGGEIGMDH